MLNSRPPLQAADWDGVLAGDLFASIREERTNLDETLGARAGTPPPDLALIGSAAREEEEGEEEDVPEEEGSGPLDESLLGNPGFGMHCQPTC